MLCRDIGPLDAPIMLIGEAPGKEEDSQGIPFVGQSGILLKAMCKAAGINYSSCYVTNICNQRPPNNKFGYFYEDAKRNVPKDALRENWFKLKDKINRIKPRVIVCLGAEPLRAVTNLMGIDKWRGTRIEAYDTKVIATYHPSAILRNYENRVVAEMDLAKAKREASLGFVYNEPEIIISPSIDDVVGWCRDVYYLSALGKDVAFDIETIGHRIRAISFAKYLPNGTISAISIPFFRMQNTTGITVTGPSTINLAPPDINYWEPHQEEIVLEEIAKILESKLISKYGQNSISFDAPLIKEEFGIDVNNHKLDLMHAWHVLYPSLPKSLSFISSAITDHPNYWTLKQTQVDESEWYYNAMDAVATLECALKVEKDLENEGLADLYYNHVHPLQVALRKAQEKGVVFDVEEAQKMKIRLSDKLKVLQDELNIFAGIDLEKDEEFNVNSPKQVAHLLYDKLGFPRIYKRGTRNVTTDEDALRKLELKYPNEPALEKIINFRKTKKLISTYIDVSLCEDGRIRCNYNASGTITGRIASSKTIWGTGMDLHNIPKGYTRGSESTRHLYKADDGNIFVGGDLKQAEAMIVGWILARLGDMTIYDLYQDPNFDIHKWCAALIYEIELAQVTKTMRQQGGKLTNHSGNYMAGPGVMQKHALKDGYKGFTYDVCKRLLAKRLKALPGLRVWWSDVERRLRATRTLETCFGRRLHFFGAVRGGRIDNTALRSAVAFEPQSTCSDVCNVIFRKMDNHEHFWPVLTTHDEVILECPIEYAEEAAYAMVEAAKIPLNISSNVKPLTIPIEMMIGYNWGNMKEWEPGDDIKEFL
jgi:uracil-DNA glycosylase family 4